MSYKLRLLVFILGGGLFAFLLLVFIVSLFTGDEKKAPGFPTQPTQSVSQLSIQLLSPPENALTSLTVISPIILGFNQTLDPESFVYEITPAVNVETELDETGKILTFKPESFWIPNTIYTLIIKTASSDQGATLSQSYMFTFKAISTSDEEHASDAEAGNNP